MRRVLRCMERRNEHVGTWMPVRDQLRDDHARRLSDQYLKYTVTSKKPGRTDGLNDILQWEPNATPHLHDSWVSVLGRSSRADFVQPRRIVALKQFLDFHRTRPP